MLLKIGAVLAAVPLAFGTAVAASGIMVVDVREGGKGGHRIVVPVPLILAEAAARLAPAAAHLKLDHQLDRVRPYLPVAEEALAALAESPDAELVRVDDGNDHVRVSKAGGVLQVRVEGPDENVSIDLPFDVLRAALSQAKDGVISAGDLVAALRRARLTRLVQVHDGQDDVTVTIW